MGQILLYPVPRRGGRMLRMLAYFLSFLSHTGCSPVDVTGIPGPPDGPPVEVAVSVDYGQRQTISLPWGFLHGVSTTIPPDSLLAPLKPTFWRSGGLARYDRVVALGARFEFVLSDGWQYPSKTFGWPWQNPQEWQAYVQKVAQQIEKKGELMGPRAAKKTMLAKQVLTELNAGGRVSKKTQLAMEDSARMAEEMPATT